MSLLDPLELRILSVLGSKPLGTIRALSEEVGISSISLSRKMDDLHSREILLAVSARIDPFSLGLGPLAVFTEVPPENLLVFEKICDLHPYTHYRIRSFGAINGVFALFSLPNQSAYLLVDLLEKLKDRGIVKSWELETPMSTMVTTETDFSYYSAESGWRFDWKAWEKIIDEAEPLALVKTPASVLDRLDEADMRILRELSKNVRKKNKEIAAAAEVKPYHLSRRWKALESMGVIQGYRVLVGMHLLQLTSHAILRCRCSMETMCRIATAVAKIPFQSTFIPTCNGFLLQTTTTYLDFPSLITALRKYCLSIETTWCDYRSSFRYWFYGKPFENGRWRTGSDFMVNSVLAEAQLD